MSLSKNCVDIGIETFTGIFIKISTEICINISIEIFSQIFTCISTEFVREFFSETLNEINFESKF